MRSVKPISNLGAAGLCLLLAWPAAGQDEAAATALSELAGRRQQAEERLAELREHQKRRRDEVEGKTSALAGRLVKIRAGIDEVEEMSSLGSERRAHADEIYAEWRELVLDLRREAVDGIERIAAAGRAHTELLARTAAERSEILDLGARTADAEAASEEIARWRRALDDALVLTAERIRLEQRFRDDVLVELRDAKGLRYRLADEISDRARDEDRGFLLEDLGSELRLIEPIAEARARHILRTATELGSHWSLFADLLVATLKLLGVVAVWWWTRRRVAPAVPALVRLWAVRTRHYHLRDLRGMEPSLQSTGVAALDLAAGGMALGLVRNALPELGLVLLLVLLLALYRLLLGTAELLVATHPEVRPAWVTLRPEPRTFLLRVLRLGVLWLMGRWLTRYLALVLLAAVALDEALRVLFDAAGIVLVVWIFHAAEPHLRAVLRRRDPDHPLGRWLAQEHLGILRSLQGLANALLLFSIWAWRLLGDRGQRLWVQLATYLRRTPASDEVPSVGPELPGEVLRHLATRECREEWYISRSAAEAELYSLWQRFAEERSAETVVLVGDQGGGKHTLVERFGRRCQRQGVPVVRVRLGERLTSADHARRWIAETFEVGEPPPAPEALAGRLAEKLAGHAVLVEDFHRAFLRCVDGFGALRYLLSVLASLQGPVFFLVTMHRPAWKYLVSLRGLVNVEVFRRVVEIEPLAEDELRRLLLARLRSSGHEVSFRPLLEGGGRSTSALERVTAEYFRRLLWASEGNPSVALALWRASLAPQNGSAALRVTAFVSDGPAPELRDDELFVLAAIYTHRSLTEEEVVAVTNMNEATVRATFRNLEPRRLLASRSKRFSLSPRYFYAILRTLRRRHIVHGSN